MELLLTTTTIQYITLYYTILYYTENWSLGMLKSRNRVGIGVLYWEILVLLGGIGISTVISVYAHYKITQIGASSIAGRISQLDEALGTAIQSILERADNVQVENPLMAILAKALDNKIEAPIIEATVMPKDDLGRFVKKIE